MIRAVFASRRPLPALGGLLLGLSLLVAAPPPIAAQTSCTPEAEPNDVAETTVSFTGTACYDGMLPDEDQDLWLWEVSETDAARRWTFSLTGIPATLTSLKVIPITSEPGTPIRGGAPVVEVNVTPTGSGATTKADLLVPVGRYVLGVSRSGTIDQSTPLRLDYRLMLEEGAPLPEPGDVEPNDQLDTATPIQGDQQLSGDLRDSVDHYRWTIPEDAPGAWDLDLQTPAGFGGYLTISRGIGDTVLNGYAAPDGHIRLPDLVLPPGRYDLSIQPPASVRLPYALTIRSKSAPDGDPEPNDEVRYAVPIDTSAGLTRGVLSTDRDRDHFALQIDEELSQLLFDVRLLWRTGQDRELCLLDEEGTNLQCARGTEGVALPSLGLDAGQYLLEVDGEPDEEPYAIRIDRAGARPRDFEAEPNDSTASATALDPAILMRGRLAPDDRDYFRATITGSPQLWRLEAEGRDLERLALVRADGTNLATGELSEARDRLTINDLFLIPGEHWIELDGPPGEYTIRLTSLGPPDPNAEREPNNETLEAEALAVARTRLGRLSEQNDTDVYRFSLTATERMLFRAEPPPDGGIDMSLWFDGNEVARLSDEEPGAPVLYDAVLEPGDYEVRLHATVPSEGRYQLTAERQDPFTLLDDQEPNDRPAIARPFPATLTLRGLATRSGDEDWYRLDPLDSAGPVTVRVDGEVSRVVLSDGSSEVPLAEDREAGTWTAESAPTGVPLFLMIRTGSDYTVDLTLPGVTPTQPTEPLAATMAIQMPVTEVAAFWPDGQRVEGTLTIANTGPTDLHLELDTVTSHFAWDTDLSQPSVPVPAGQSVELAVLVTVPADVPGGVPVRITVRARDAAGAQQTAAVEIVPTQDAPAVDPYQAWSVPAPMLGGLDVASLALGAVPMAATDAEAEAEAKLHDGVTPSGTGFYAYPETKPHTLTVDLAGDQPIPIVGTVLNPQSTGSAVREMPRGFELWLSTDGVEYENALTGELLPLTVDQAFLLESPVAARFAQLRITSVHADEPFRIVLGEWKVIAQPGVTPGDEPLNIADPSRGGHVVRMEPHASSQDFADTMLTEDRRREWLPVRTGLRPSWVVGFADDRAARITGLEWVDPENHDPNVRFRRLDVSISLESPLGPWQPLGEWQIRHHPDGTPDVLALDQPTWARFVRFVGDAPRGDDSQYRELPGVLRIREQPTDDGYRSVVAEWGQASRAGPYELAHPSISRAGDAGADDNDTPETADPFESGVPANGRVHIDRDVDWYTIGIPEGQNSLRLEVAGTPTVGVSLTLMDPGGIEVPMTFGRGTQPGTVGYAATVTPGGTYLLRVQQPPFSAIVTFDTSGSMSAYYPYVVQGVRAFTADVVRGREGVNLIPFEEEPLLDTFSDEPFVLQDAIDRYVLGSGSSGAEQAILDASKELVGRQGARAILVLTDAESSTYSRHAEMWADLEAVRPMVFSVHVGGDSKPVETRHTMQDWAAAGAGVYQYARSHAEVDRAFDRLATWLRRPATYTLRYTTSEEQLPPPDPGSLSVLAAPNDDGSPGEAPVRSDVSVEIILDTSGSMLKDLGGRRRIDVAKEVLRDLVHQRLPAGTPVALRVLGSRAQPCRTQLAVPLGPLDPDTITDLVDPITVDQRADTPIGAALRAVADDLAGATGSRIVLLITDSEETWPHRDLCGLDPGKAVRELRREGIDAHLNIVGLAVRNRRARSQMVRWARIGAGSYFDARNPEQLNRAVATAASAPFQVFDVAGAQAASGTVNGAPIELPPGTYRVVVLTEPEVVFEAVVLDSGGNVSLTLPVRTIEEEGPAAEGEPP
jgi:hypothetical protein